MPLGLAGVRRQVQTVAMDVSQDQVPINGLRLALTLGASPVHIQHEVRLDRQPIQHVPPERLPVRRARGGVHQQLQRVHRLARARHREAGEELDGLDLVPRVAQVQPLPGLDRDLAGGLADLPVNRVGGARRLKKRFAGQLVAPVDVAEAERAHGHLILP